MSSIRVVATVVGETHAALAAARDEAAREADLVELRLDMLREPIDVEGVLRRRPKPVILTCRRPQDGGAFTGSERDRREILLRAVGSSAEYVDLEWQAGLDDLVAVRGGRGIVLSMHDFAGLPADLERRLESMLSAGTEVVKLAVMCTRLSDCIRLAGTSALGGPRVLALVGMGTAGLATRVLPARFGSSWTYAGASAPGQVSLELMLRRYRVRSVSDSTRVYGVAGRPVGASLSPAMHNASFHDADVDAVYIPLETGSADDLLEFAEWLPLAGVSVTAPLKRDVFERVGVRDRAAERAGAVNTIKRVADGWVATNTDIDGFRAPLLAHGLDPRGRRVAILGAGGAARAAAVALADAGAIVSVHARRLEAARDVAELASGTAYDCWPVPGAWDLLVNATPSGWQSGTDLLGPASAGAWVYDLVSTPETTPLVARAEAAGCHTIRGVEMLVAQGEAQAQWWTGRGPRPGVMSRAAHEELRGIRCA